MNPTKKLGNFLWRVFDVKIIDDIGPNGVVALCKKGAERISKMQTGYIYHYALSIILGLMIAVFLLIRSFKQLIGF